MSGHPLDRPVWGALTGPQAEWSFGNSLAVRFHPDIGPLAATGRDDAESLAALAKLLPEQGVLGTVQSTSHDIPAGAVVERRAALLQFVADGPMTAIGQEDVVQLGEADAPEMQALAALTEPGPFAARTHQLGGFWGIRVDGRLAAMAGERMRLSGYGEVSAVCTHPDFRGRGLAERVASRAMMQVVGRGLTPFLHSYADNVAAIRLYEKLGFRPRATVIFTLLRRAD